MGQKNQNPNVLTPECRVSYVHVFRPQKAMNAGEDPRYSVVALFKPGEDLAALKNAAAQACAAEWGPDPSKWPSNLHNPFRDQGDKEGTDGYVKGAKFLTATSKNKPGLVIKVNGVCHDIVEEKDFYSGCYAILCVRPFTFDIKGKRGVSFGLQHVLKMRDGEPLGGRTNPTDAFKAVESAAAPAGGASSGIFD